MLGSIEPSSSPEAIAHIIQVALTPVFLLSGIATLLNVFSNRLARVADRVYHLSDVMRTAERSELVGLAPELTRLHHRSIVLDCAVLLGTAGARSYVHLSFHTAFRDIEIRVG